MNVAHCSFYGDVGQKSRITREQLANRNLCELHEDFGLAFHWAGAEPRVARNSGRRASESVAMAGPRRADGRGVLPYPGN